MYYSLSMQPAYEAENRKKALAYTVIICVILLLIGLISWPVLPPPQVMAQDLIEVNLGNEEEGFGETQPLIKGDMSPESSTTAAPQQATAVQNNPNDDVPTDDKPDEDAAPVNKTEKTNTPKNNINKPAVIQPVKTKQVAAVTTPAPKPQKPKFTYKGPGNGGGNGANEDNGYRYQGNNPNGKGDHGVPTGNPDSYGNTPGGRTGGPKVFGNRKIVKYYSFTGELEKATVYAIVKVSPAGTGTFVGFAKNSSTRAPAYANAIVQYLRNVKFDQSTEESTVTVQFNFNIN